jgi:hypothetical protein
MTERSKCMGAPAQREEEAREGLCRHFTRWGAGVGLPMLTLAQLRAEDQVGYRHEFYQEDASRILVGTDTLLVQKLLTPWLDLDVMGVHDAISGATPIGVPAADSFTLHPTGTTLSIPGTAITGYRKVGSVDGVSGASPSAAPKPVSPADVPVAEMKDTRWALDMKAGLTFGPHRLTPEFSYSQEKDYISYSGALNYAFQLNEKNTTLKAGWSHSADRIIPNTDTFIKQNQYKDTDDVIVGVSQLLGPKTVLDFNVGLGFGSGYFDDPYRGVIFEGEVPTADNMLTIYGEKRPSTRNRQTGQVSLTQAVSSLNASVEGSYRYYHDTFDINAHTVTLAWHQKAGSFLVISPAFRYYWQSAASFYGTIFSGDPVTDPAAVPTYYSADYRLSNMETFTLGIQASIKVREWLSLDLGFQRYIMNGLDNVTSPSAYTSANIYTVGARIWF